MLEIRPEDKKRIQLRRLRDYLSWLVALVIAGTLTYSLLTNPNYQWDVVAKYFTHESIISGIGITLSLTAVSMILGCALGLVLALMQDSKNRPIAAIAYGYITFFRGTPVLVQLIFWFNFAALYPNLSLGVPFTAFQYEVDTNALMGPLTAAIIGLTLNEAAYMAEIIRGGFAAVDKGQIEAADSLGMSFSTKLRAVLLPQIMPAVIPPTGNQLISMLKGTSLVSVLGVADLLQSAQLIYARTYETIPLLIVASLWYLADDDRARNTPIHDREVLRAIGPAAGRRSPTDRAAGGAGMNGEGTIVAREIRKSFGSHLVLAGIDVTVAAGEITCIIGPSGSGKSTLLRCINGLETVDSGVLRVNGEDLGFRETPSAYIALSHAALALPASTHRHGLPGVQPVPPHDRRRERHGRTGAREGHRQGRGQGAGRRSPGQRGPGRVRTPLPRAAVRWAKTARRDLSRAGHGTQHHALRRAHQRARPGTGR